MRAVTDAVLEEVTAWQGRGLEAAYAIVFFDAIRVKIRDEGMVNNRGYIWPLAYAAPDTSKSWESGSSRLRARSSGCG